MSPSTTPTSTQSTSTQSLEQALTGLPPKLRVHELAKRAGAASRDVIAALAELGVPVSSAASSVGAADATAVLTALLGAAQSAEAAPANGAVPDGAVPDPAASTREAGPGDRAPSDDAAPPTPDPGFFAAPLFLPPAEAKPVRRRRGAKQPAEPQPDLTQLPEDSVTAITAAEPVVTGDEPAAATSGGRTDESEAAETTEPAGASRAGRRRRGRSSHRGRGEQSDALPADTGTQDATLPEAADEVAAAGRSEQVLAGPDSAEPAGPPPVDPGEQESEHFERSVTDDEEEDGDQARRRRRRGRRGRGRVGDDRADEPAEAAAAESDDPQFQEAERTSGDGGPADGPGMSDEDASEEDGEDESGEEGGTRRRRRRRRRGASADGAAEDKTQDDPDNTVVHVREVRSSGQSSSSSNSEVQGVRGSTRLEAKRQRRRDSRDSRKRPQILTEAEFLARREAVDRVMAVRQRGDLAQVALLEDGILVEHFVSRAGSESLMGNIYLGKVQNVLPSMEAAFVDIGKGRNAVLYAGEVNWDAAGLAGKARRIETALSGGDTILVQVSKDPVGQKGARLTTQISLPGRFLVYVPGGGATGISRKLPDTERKRLKSILDRIVPEDAGVIIRTAAEGVAADELARDVERLKNQWDGISRQAEKKSNAPQLLSAEPDTLIKVVRDLFNSDISRLVLDGDRAYEPVASYINGVAPELANRVSRYDGPNDVFSAYRIDEQIAKALERKVYLPSGGSLVIDRTEAMTVIDVNTGKYTGSGGNLEETVTKNNLEAAEEVVRQLRLRDIGGIIVVDFIDMVLESNRELVMRRLTECLGRDRTRHQVAEVTSLGLIQMTRKKMGTGLVEAFSEPCPHCQGRGILLHDVPMEDRSGNQDALDPDAGRSRQRRGKGRSEPAPEPEPSAKMVPATVRPPDPRGPKPPARISDEPAADLPDRPALDVGRAAGTLDAGHRVNGDDAAFNAPRSRDASDAVSAVLAALDAQTERRAGQAAAVPSDVTGASGSGGEPRDSGAAGGRRRGRRASGRAAGAPTVAAGTSAPDASTVDAGPVGEVEAASVATAPGSAQEVIVEEVRADAPARAASELAATDLVVAPDVDAQLPDAVSHGPDGQHPTGERSGEAVDQDVQVRSDRPARRRGTRAAGAAKPAAGPGAEPAAGTSEDQTNGSALTAPAQSDPTGESARDDVPAVAVKAPPSRRRRAASRPAGPAGGTVKAN